MLNEAELKREIELFSRYLVAASPTPQAEMLYVRALQQQPVNDKLSQWVIRHPFLLPFADAATGLFGLQHPYRKKLIIAFAILETQPVFAHHFLPENAGYAKGFSLLLKGISSIIKALLGWPLLLL